MKNSFKFTLLRGLRTENKRNIKSYGRKQWCDIGGTEQPLESSEVDVIWVKQEKEAATNRTKAYGLTVPGARTGTQE